MLLQDAVYFDEEYALPGFHIFVLDGSDQSQRNLAARAHFDLQWMDASPQYPTGTLSFTLPVEEPTGGASLAIWPIRYAEALQSGFSARDYASMHPPQTVSYACGRLVVHDGLTLHAIGDSSSATPKGLRITLQGHGIRLPHGWILYW
jgi:hypothetical protein